MDCTFIHGMNNDAGVWDPVITSMTGSLGVVHAPQLSATNSVDELAREVADSVPRGVLVGHSFGGAVAQAFAALYPDKVTGLVLVASTLGADTPAQAAARRARVDGLASESDYVDLAMSVMAQVYHPDNVDDSQLRSRRRVSVERYGLARFRAHTIAAGNRMDRTVAVGALGVPILVVAPEADAVIPSERQQEFADTVGAQFTQIDGTGHMLPAETPDRLGAVIREWASAQHL